MDRSSDGECFQKEELPMNIRKCSLIIGLLLLCGLCLAGSSWELPKGIKAQYKSPRRYRFTTDYTTSDTQGRILQVQRIMGDFTRLPGGDAVWDNFTLTDLSDKKSPLGPAKKCQYINGLSYHGDASIQSTMDPAFFKGFPDLPAAVMERTIVWDTLIFDYLAQNHLENLKLNQPYHLVKDQTVDMSGSGTFENRDLQIVWTGRSQRNGQDCALIDYKDIQMPRLNGFDVLARLPFQPLVVFTTAFEQYALKAFSVNSIDYLLKPVDAEQLERAITKIETMRSLGSSLRPDLNAALEGLARSLRQNNADFPNRIASRLGDRLQFIDLSTVTHFYAEDKLTYAVSGGKSYSVDSTISNLETKLDPTKFLRIHRSTLINVDWLKEISSLPGGGLNVRLKSGIDLTVSRDRARDFKFRLGC
jgi:two-component system LytT family response regulator